MSLSKTNAKKFINIITKSKKKVFTCEDLSCASGIKVDVIRDYISEFYGMIYLDPMHNLIDILPNLNKYVEIKNKTAPRKVKNISHKEYEKYSSVTEYINKNMTLPGGIFDSGYVLNTKDRKILKRLLNKK